MRSDSVLVGPVLTESRQFADHVWGRGLRKLGACVDQSWHIEIVPPNVWHPNGKLELKDTPQDDGKPSKPADHAKIPPFKDLRPMRMPKRRPGWSHDAVNRSKQHGGHISSAPGIHPVDEPVQEALP